MSDTPQPKHEAELRRPPFFSSTFLAWLACLLAFVAVPALVEDVARAPTVFGLFFGSLLARALWPRKPSLRVIDNGHALRDLGLSVPWVSLGVSFACVSLMVWMQAWGVVQRPFGLVSYGANFPWWLRFGEIDRLATSNFLHVDWAHLASNVSVLLVAGVWLESRRFLAALLLSGLGAALVAATVLLAWPSAAFVVGASAFVYAALGYWCVTRGPGRGAQLVCFLCLVVHCVLNAWGPGVSWPMHLAGLCFGAVFARVLTPRAAPWLGIAYAVALVVSFARVSPDGLAVRDFALVARSPETLRTLAEYYSAEAQATGAYAVAISRLRPMLGDGFYREPPQHPVILLRFAELLVLAWQRGVSAQPRADREACGVIVEAQRVTGIFCGAPADAQHVVVWVGESRRGEPGREATARAPFEEETSQQLGATVYKSWPVRH